MNTTGIYKITNKINNKIYIGSSKNIFNRWLQHLDLLLKNEHHNYNLQNDFNIQGKNVNDFNFEILEITDEDILKDDLLILEGKYIIENQSYKNNIGYNIVINKSKTINIKKDKETKDDYFDDVNYYQRISDKDYLLLKNNLNIVGLELFKDKFCELNKNNNFLSKSWFNNNDNKQIKNMLVNFFRHYCEDKSSLNLWTTFIKNKDCLKGKGYTKGFVKIDNYEKQYNQIYVAFVANIYLNSFSQLDTKQNKLNNNKYALSILLKWIINTIDYENNKIKLFIPSSRMKNLLCNFLNDRSCL